MDTLEARAQRIHQSVVLTVTTDSRPLKIPTGQSVAKVVTDSPVTLNRASSYWLLTPSYISNIYMENFGVL